MCLPCRWLNKALSFHLWTLWQIFNSFRSVYRFISFSLYPNSLKAFYSTTENLPVVKVDDSQVRNSIVLDQWFYSLIQRANAACLQLIKMALSSALLFSGCGSLTYTDMGDEFLSLPWNDKHFNHIYPPSFFSLIMKFLTAQNLWKHFQKLHIFSFMNNNSAGICDNKSHHFFPFIFLS